MDAIRALLQFTLDHPYMVILVFLVGFVSALALTRLPDVLFLIPSKLLPWRSIYRFIMRVPRFLFARGASWAYYRLSSDAVILARIDLCRRFLKLHFDEGQRGEVWLFRSDLRAFWQCDAFEELYKEIVDANENISWVRILIPQSYINSARSEIWDRIFVHLGALGRRDRIVYRRLEDAEIAASIDAEFLKYASDESFIFYTRGTRLRQQETICVHRRFSLEADHTSDLRITLVAAREGDSYAKDPLHKFLPNYVADKFETMFGQTTGTWATLYSLAEAQRGRVPSPHACS